MTTLAERQPPAKPPLTPEERSKQDDDDAAYEAERLRPLRVVLLDTVTGERRPSHLDWPADAWHQGNGSCDCNRELSFDDDGAAGDDGRCLGCHRFLIVEADTTAYTLDELNEEYPEELRHRFLTPEAKP